MLGPIISGIGSVLGGLFGQNNQKKQMQAQMDAQKEFAQKGIRWRVEDAKAAGIHPLAALGAQTTSFSPIGIPGSPLAEGMSQAGQEIGRAIEAKGTTAERAFNLKMQTLQLQRGELENQLLASQIARINSPTQLPPPMPSAVSGSSATPGSVIDGQNTATPPERVAGWLDPPTPNGRAIPIWVKGRDRDGKEIWIPNPDGPDAEQLAFAAITRAQAGWEAAARTLIAPPPVRVTPVEREGSWRDYIPSIDFEWK